MSSTTTTKTIAGIEFTYEVATWCDLNRFPTLNCREFLLNDIEAAGLAIKGVSRLKRADLLVIVAAWRWLTETMTPAEAAAWLGQD